MTFIHGNRSYLFWTLRQPWHNWYTSAGRKDQIAIWQSALLQHFDTPNRNYPSDGIASQTSCLAIKEGYSCREGYGAQHYSKIHKMAFAKLCHTNQSCGNMSMNAKSMDFRTVCFYWLRITLQQSGNVQSRTCQTSQDQFCCGISLIWWMFPYGIHLIAITCTSVTCQHCMRQNFSA